MPKGHSPVSLFGVSTGFDCEEPFCLIKKDNTSRAKTERNSLCQFWKDSNQNRLSEMYWDTVDVGFPICSKCSFSFLILPCKWIPKEKKKRQVVTWGGNGVLFKVARYLKSARSCIVTNLVGKYPLSQNADCFFGKARGAIESAGFRLQLSLMHPN